MPRPRGPQSADSSIVIATRFPHVLAENVFENAGARSGSQLAEWIRNVMRRAVRVPLDYDAGYEEGKAAGWANAQERFRAAIKGA